MIEFSFNNSKGKIDENFNVYFEQKEIKEFLEKMLEMFLLDLQPSSGDPFLMFADKMQKKGFKIIKAKPQDEGKEEIY